MLHKKKVSAEQNMNIVIVFFYTHNVHTQVVEINIQSGTIGQAKFKSIHKLAGKKDRQIG